ncbi:MAG: TonB-dependent receptor [Peptostreptococcaceae bacterium]|nr:TonB-dependent receptor [Peptostreptococcaceae bacterium]
MKKKWFNEEGHFFPLLKCLRIMKLTAFILLVSLVHLSASVYSQQIKLDVSLRNATIRDVLKSIEDQSGYFFLYTNEDIDVNRKVSVDFKDVSVEQILDQVFQGTDISYRISDRQIVLIKNNLEVNSFQSQQQKMVKGKVTDSSGSPLPGVTIVIKGTTHGTITDANGNYSLNNISENATLIFSFIGMKTQEIAVAGHSVINVELVPKMSDIGEVVVVGYGIQKKESVVGAISQAKGAELEKSGGVSSLGAALTGNLAGVITVASTGSPGQEDPKIYIRGLSTWNNSDPLILVDGIERPMNSVDIGSVESISVLKDASATAVFGTRGANGVVLITTKRGKEGKAVIRVTVNATIKTPSELATKMDSYDALGVRSNAIENELGLFPTAWAQYQPQGVRDLYRNQTTDLQRETYPNVDWRNTLVKKSAMSYNTSLNVSGGNSSVKYFTAVDYLSEGDILNKIDNGKTYNTGYGYQRLNVRNNLDINLTKTTILTANLAGSYGVRQDAYGQDDWEYRIWQAIYSSAPNNFLPRYSDGSWGYYKPDAVGSLNSTNTLANNGVRKTTDTQITTDFTLKQDLSMILNGLKAMGTLSYDNKFANRGGIYDNGNVQETYIDPLTGQVSQSQYLGVNQFDWIPPRWSTRGDGYDPANSAQDNQWMNDQTYRKTYYKLQLDYARKFGKHDVTAMGLFSRDQYATGSEFIHLREDWVSRVTYNYAFKYFAEFNGAYNGSEKFGPNNRFAFFPSGAIGWMVSEEKFMKKLQFLDMLKLKASYGEVGDDSGRDRWLYMTQWAYGGVGGQAGVSNLGSNAGDTSPAAYTWWRESVIGNANIHWEKVAKQNYGVDYSFLHGLLSGSVNFFNDYRTDILLNGANRSVPSYFGGTPATANLGSVRSKGYELEFHVNKALSKDFRLFGDLSITHAKDKVLEADDPQLKDAYQKKIGKQINQTYSGVSSGYYNNWDEVYGSVKLNTADGNKLPGYYNLVDYNGDGVIDTKDDVPYGYSDRPQNTYSTKIGFDWKHISMFVQFYGVTNVTRYVNLGSLSAKFDRVYTQETFWTKDNLNADVPYPRWNATLNNSGTQFLYDASYLRLKNMEIAYTFDKSMVRKLGLGSLRVYLNGDNLLLWTQMPDDREANNGSNSAYPTVRRINLGLNITL